ncbi:MAG: alpha-mannosidase [Micrococcaceae bacterium]|nr:alpha-mannosidase [Micrococcaceae bacterium]
MHDDRTLTEARVDRFLRSRLEPAIYAARQAMTVTGWVAPGEPVTFAEAAQQDYVPVEPGQAWGAPWSTWWLRITGTVPAGWPKNDVELLVDLGFTLETPGFQAEGIAWRVDGTVAKGISPRNSWVPLALLATGDDGVIDFYVEAAANPDVAAGFGFEPNGLGDPLTAGREPQYRLGTIEAALLDRQAWELLQDVRTLRGLMHELPADQPRRHGILRALERMMDAVDPDDVGGSAPVGRDILAAELAKPATASAHTLVATGHAHIDSAWLWPVRETIRKCARTFSNALALMDRDPDFVFSCSSAQQLSWIKEFYPDLFERIRAKVASGQFVPVGGMWVESDTNMPGGEAMARQFLEGKSFFQREFGIDCQETWLPDSFGYSAALPQIAASAGMKWFLTQKISWNQVNTMPHHTFRWEGLDGTRLFTHFPPADTYNAQLTGAELAHAERNYRDHGHGNISLIPFGYGDGGGGPTREMVATAHRTANLEGSPRVVLGSAQTFFRRAEAEYPQAPVWVGEMYLELHRGTYTSQANTKKGNRRSEHLLREAELWCATAAVRAGAEYPAAELKRIWHLVLLQQFHDILPGSSIAWVHRDAERNYAAVERDLEKLIGSAVSVLASGVPDSDSLVFNAAPQERNGVPALGAAAPALPAEPVQVTALDGGYVLDNGLIRAVLDSRGLLTSLRDYVSGREAIPPGSFGNQLELHRDTPNQWDAWDLDSFYRNVSTSYLDARSVTLERAGWDAVVVVERLVHDSPVTQRIRLAAGSPSLQISTSVDWRESEKILKLGFPLDLRADRSASETQFGHVFRPTTTNTSWEAARFEICAHRWLHVGEPGYGVALANSSTYGHDVTRNVRSSDGGTTTTVRLSLLRAPHSPDPSADLGLHELTVSLRPGATLADAVEEGYRTNLPLRRPGSAVDQRREAPFGGAADGGRVEPLVSVFNAAVVVEAIKLAEDGSGDVIVRLYESLGERSTAVLHANFPVTGIWLTDLLEAPTAGGPEQLPGADAVELTLRPFQLVTVRFGRG